VKILIFVTQFYQLSGAEKLAVELAKGLLSIGVEVELLSMYSETLPGVEVAKNKLLREGINSITFLDLPINPSIPQLFTAFLKLRCKIKMHKYNAIEASMLGPITLACWSAIGLKTRVVAGIHAVFDRNMHNSLKYKLWRYSANVKKNITYYAISKAVANAWAKYSHTSIDKIHVIYNGIQKEYFLKDTGSKNIRSELGVPDDAKVILFVGSLLYYKGIDILFEAIAPLLHENNCYLLLVGEGDKSEKFYPGKQDYMLNINKIVADGNLRNKVFFLGHRDDVHSIMAGCDALAHPARTEGFGLVLAEALAAGLPIVATDVGGIPEVLEDTLSLLVPTEDPVALRQGISKLLMLDDKAKTSYIKAGKIKAEQYKSAHRIDKMLSLFSQ
jgi:glycosyltransferase involved in cell wall biosynthesis